MELENFIRGLPKAELHLHIEGTLEPELMFTLADRNKIKLSYQSPDDLRKAYDFKDLQSFLDIYYQGVHVLQTAQDFYDLAMAYFDRAQHDGVTRAEVFFDPQSHVSRGVDFSVLMDGLWSASKDAYKKWGIESALILCFLRHLSEREAFETFHQAVPYQDKISGFGLDSSENGHPPAKFKNVFNDVREHGFHVVAHAGEEGPADYIWEALTELQAKRIDHGVRCLEDAALVDYLVKHQIPLTVCPYSNLKLRVVDQLEDHPIQKMLDLGLNVSINSDDPAYFGGYVLDNYVGTAKALNLTQGEIEKLCENSLRSCLH